MSFSKSSQILHPYAVKMLVFFLLFFTSLDQDIGPDNASKNNKYLKSFDKVYSR